MLTFNTYSKHFMVKNNRSVNRANYKLGYRVHIVKKKKTFERGFTPNWTKELFTVNKVKDTKPVMYTIEDTKGREIHGTFYQPE